MKNKRNNRVLITGSTGFVGSHLAERLHRDGWQVTATGRSMVKGKALLAKGIYFLPVDFTNRAAIMKLCKDQDVVIHCGARSSAWGALNDFRLANVVGTQNVLDGCREHDVRRLVHVSTPSIYFNGNSKLDVTENEPLPSRAINAYAQTKREAEALVDQAVVDGLSAITVRPRAIYGPGDQALIPRIIRSLRSNRMRIIGDGNNIQNLTYVENLVDALILCAEAGEQYTGQKYNVTDGSPVRIWDLIDCVAEALKLPRPQKKISARTAMMLAGCMELFHQSFRPDVEPVLTRYGVSVLSQSQTLSIRAIEKDLGYTARVSFDEGFKQTMDWARR